MVFGLWFELYGLCFMVYGLFFEIFLVYGAWFEFLGCSVQGVRGRGQGLGLIVFAFRISCIEAPLHQQKKIEATSTLSSEP